MHPFAVRSRHIILLCTDQRIAPCVHLSLGIDPKLTPGNQHTRNRTTPCPSTPLLFLPPVSAAFIIPSESTSAPGCCSITPDRAILRHHSPKHPIRQTTNAHWDFPGQDAHILPPPGIPRIVGNNTCTGRGGTDIQAAQLTA